MTSHGFTLCNSLLRLFSCILDLVDNTSNYHTRVRIEPHLCQGRGGSFPHLDGLTWRNTLMIGRIFCHDYYAYSVCFELGQLIYCEGETALFVSRNLFCESSESRPNLGKEVTPDLYTPFSDRLCRGLETARDISLEILLLYFLDKHQRLYSRV